MGPMTGRIQTRVAIFAALADLAAVMVPAGLAAGADGMR